MQKPLFFAVSAVVNCFFQDKRHCGRIAQKKAAFQIEFDNAQRLREQVVVGGALFTSNSGSVASRIACSEIRTDWRSVRFH